MHSLSNESLSRPLSSNNKVLTTGMTVVLQAVLWVIGMKPDPKTFQTLNRSREKQWIFPSECEPDRALAKAVHPSIEVPYGSFLIGWLCKKN